MRPLIIACILCLFALLSCESPCANVVCENGGNCIRGECLCATGYMGTFCEQEDVPSLMVLKEVSLTSFPAKISRNGGWDNNNGPDIYIVLQKGDSTLYTHNAVFENAAPNERYSFENLGIELDFPENRYKILLYDSDDPDEGEFMGEIEFTPYQNGKGFPTEVSLDEGGITLDLKLGYEFQ